MFLIDRAQQRHIPGMHQAFDRVAREKLHFSTLEAVPITEFTRWMEGNIGSNCPQFVAISGNELIGWCIVCTYKQSFVSHSGSIFMGLLPQWRSMGIGTKLLNKAVNQAWKQGLTRLELEVYSDNVSAVHLYRKIGFFTEGVKRHAHFLDGRYRDVLSMAMLSQTCEAISIKDFEAAE